MRLFGKVDGVVNRYDRAEWLSIPFDLAFASVAPPSVVITPTGRTYDVPFEDRILQVPFEDRIFEVKP